MLQQIQTSQPQSTKSARLEARITCEQKELLELASIISGQSLSQFVTTVLQKAAFDIIQEHKLLKLTKASQTQFINALLSPPKPNGHLKSAAKKYRERIKEKEIVSEE